MSPDSDQARGPDIENPARIEIVQTRRQMENGEIHHEQVVLKADVTLEGEYP
jgi:hypothetical protein